MTNIYPRTGEFSANLPGLKAEIPGTKKHLPAQKVKQMHGYYKPGA